MSNLIIKVLKWVGTSNNEIAKCYKNRLRCSVCIIRKINNFFKKHSLTATDDYIFWKNKLLDELKT